MYYNVTGTLCTAMSRQAKTLLIFDHLCLNEKYGLRYIILNEKYFADIN